MPVVDKLAVEYEGQVRFVAPAWKATSEETARRAAELMPSGRVAWGLDESEGIFAAFGVPYQPATVLIDGHGAVVDSWLGGRSENEMRAAVEALLARG